MKKVVTIVLLALVAFASSCSPEDFEQAERFSQVDLVSFHILYTKTLNEKDILQDHTSAELSDRLGFLTADFYGPSGLLERSRVYKVKSRNGNGVPRRITWEDTIYELRIGYRRDRRTILRYDGYVGEEKVEILTITYR